MRAGDISQVMEIEREAAAIPWTRAMFLADIGQPGALDLVAMLGENLLGYVMVSRHADVWHILNITVHRSHRGRGVGGRLLDETFDRADRRPHLGFTLEVRVSNRRAIDLYERRGFISHGIRPGYYSDNGEDALIMWRSGEPT